MQINFERVASADHFGFPKLENFTTIPDVPDRWPTLDLADFQEAQVSV